MSQPRKPTRGQRAARALDAMRDAEFSVRYRRVKPGKRVWWYGYTLGREGPLCRTPVQAIERFLSTPRSADR